MNIIEDTVDNDADVTWGTTTDPKMENNRVEVTLIATGFERSIEEKKQVASDNVADRRKALLESMGRNSIFSRQKVSSGDFNGDETYDELDEPAFLRNQMD